MSADALIDAKALCEALRNNGLVVLELQVCVGMPEAEQGQEPASAEMLSFVSRFEGGGGGTALTVQNKNSVPPPEPHGTKLQRLPCISPVAMATVGWMRWNQLHLRAGTPTASLASSGKHALLHSEQGPNHLREKRLRLFLVPCQHRSQQPRPVPPC